MTLLDGKFDEDEYVIDIEVYHRPKGGSKRGERLRSHSHTRRRLDKASKPKYMCPDGVP